MDNLLAVWLGSVGHGVVRFGKSRHGRLIKGGGMAEMGDAPDLKSGGEMQSTRAGSNPAIATKFEIPLGCDLGVSKEMYEKFEEALIKATVEKLVPVEVGAFGGMKVFVQPYMPKDMAVIVGPDPDLPGRTKIVKIIKFVP